MQNLGATYSPNSFKPASNRYVGFAFAAAINLVAVWAILDGLNIHPSASIPPTTTIQILPQTAPSKPVVEPPHPTMVKPTTTTEVVPKPFFAVQPASQSTIVATTQQTPPGPPVPDSSASGLTDTHTTPPYPADARNLGHQGTVTLALSIDATGAVTDAQVRVSSGYPELDQTAVSWVIAHWRYKAAVQNGTPVASTTLAAVKFDLKNAR
jgi:protein TonB